MIISGLLKYWTCVDLKTKQKNVANTHNLVSVIPGPNYQDSVEEDSGVSGISDSSKDCRTSDIKNWSLTLPNWKNKTHRNTVLGRNQNTKEGLCEKSKSGSPSLWISQNEWVQSHIHLTNSPFGSFCQECSFCNSYFFYYLNMRLQMPRERWIAICFAFSGFCAFFSKMWGQLPFKCSISRSITLFCPFHYWLLPLKCFALTFYYPLLRKSFNSSPSVGLYHIYLQKLSGLDIIKC